MRILTISKKVITELIRDKRSLALMFIAPLLILWLMNVMFSASSDITITLGTSGVKAGLVKKLDKVSGVSVKKASVSETFSSSPFFSRNSIQNCTFSGSSSSSSAISS